MAYLRKYSVPSITSESSFERALVFLDVSAVFFSHSVSPSLFLSVELRCFTTMHTYYIYRAWMRLGIDAVYASPHPELKWAW